MCTNMIKFGKSVTPAPDTTRMVEVYNVNKYFNYGRPGDGGQWEEEEKNASSLK